MLELAFLPNSFEPKSIVCNGQERLTQSTKWNHTMPPLFPILGHAEHVVMINGNPYLLFNHGFVRNAQYDEMKVCDASTSFTFHFKKDEMNYPYDVNFTVIYECKGQNELAVTYLVHNLEDNEICFSVGGHPGFSLIPGTKPEDYEVSFLCESDSLFCSNSNYPNSVIKGNSIAIKSMEPEKALFVSGFDKEEEHRKLCYLSYKGKAIMHFYFHNDTKYFGIWYREDNNNPFICLEPWSSPSINQIKGDLSLSSEVIKLKGRDSYQFCYEMLFIPFTAK